MKKLLRTLLLAAALTALLCVSALAADSAVSITGQTGATLTPKTAADAPITANADGKYENAVKFDVNATGTQGSQYLLLVLRDQKVPTEQNIVYINQAAAGANGAISFTGSDAAYPMTMTSGTYYVYLVGDGKSFDATKADASFTYDAGYELGNVLTGEGEENININDAMEVIYHIVGRRTLSETQQMAANVVRGENEEGININDAMQIIYYIVGKIDKF